MELMIPVSGGEIWAEDTGGDATLVVLVNPGWGIASIWSPLIAALGDRYRVIRYDDRRFGRSPLPATSFTRLADLRAVLDAIASRIPGCGHVIIPGADHLLPLRVPARLAEIITDRAG